MFLRQIQIRGFKSFADKTVLEFIPGVSVIVGPNGSGKSNLVDAISWALGETGAGDDEGPGEDRPVAGRYRPHRDQRGVRRRLGRDGTSHLLNLPADLLR